MLIQEPGKVTERIDFLGTRKTCLYLLKGKEAMIIGGGMSWSAPSLERQFSAMDFDLKKIKYLVIQHSHFDHCGAVPYLKRKFPYIQIVASAYSKEVLSMEKVIEFIADINKQTIEKLGLQDEYKRLDLRFDGIQVDRVIVENDTIDLGEGIKAHFLEVPGHTKCCIAVYVPGLKAMFPSDSVPFPTDDGSELSYPSPQYDFPLFLESLRKLATYEVALCGFEHHGIFIGEQAKKVLRQGLEQTERFRDYLMEQYQRLGDWDKVAQRFATEEVERIKFPSVNLELQTSLAKTVISKVLR